MENSNFNNLFYNQIKLFVENTRGIFGVYGTFERCIKLMFLKHIYMEFSKGTESDIPNSMEDMQIMMQFQSLFLTKEYNKQIIYKSFMLIDRYYGLNGLLLKNIDSFELLLHDDKNRDFVFNMLTGLDFPSDYEFRYEFLTFVYNYCQKDNKIYQNNYSNNVLLSIVDKILDVKENEFFMDPCCGYSSSMLKINCDNYIGVEINSECAQISVMAGVMLGKRRFQFKIINNDYLQFYNEQSIDKVFAEVPLGVTVDDYYLYDHIAFKSSNYPTKEFELLLMYKVINELNNKGRAVVAVSPKVLISELKSYSNFRNYLIENKLLKGVILLSSLWGNSTSIDTALLIIEKTTNNFIKFVDYTKLNKKYNSKSIKSGSGDELIDAVISAYFEDEITGVSKLVNYKEIIDNKCILSPCRYITFVENKEYRSVEVIDKEIENILDLIIKNAK